MAPRQFGEANLPAGQVKRDAHAARGRSQIGAGTSEIRWMLIGREYFSETM